MAEGDQRKDPKEGLRPTAALNLGITFASGVAVLSFFGHWLDTRRGGGMVWTLTGLFLGLAYGALETWKVVRSMNEDGHDDSGKSA